MLVLLPQRSSHCIVLLVANLFLLLVAIAPTPVFCLSLLPTASSSSSSPERTVVLLLHKSPNVVTSHVSHDDRSTVYDQVQDMTAHVDVDDDDDDTTTSFLLSSFQEVTQIRSKLHAIGRLDADTTGLILLTNDGGLVHHVTNKNAASLKGKNSNGIFSIGTITKTYQALVMGHHTEESLSIFWDGVDIGTKYGGMTQPVDDLKILNHPTRKSTLVELTISEGKNRQVRRMFHSIGSGVMQLKRVAIGCRSSNKDDDDASSSLTLEGLQEGQWRILSEKEVRNALQWDPKILEERPVGKPRKGSSSNGRSGSAGPRGRGRFSSTPDQPRRRRSSGKKRRNNDSRGANSSRRR